MSETDDTDELLLIPPDFFVTNPPPDTLGPYYNVVDSLISQVNHLENRINLIESSSEFSLSLISDSPEMNSPSRKYGEDKNYASSTQSTPQKPRTRFTLNSLPNSPDLERLKTKTTLRSKKSDINPMLGEIDSFISNVKLIKRLNTVRNLESEFEVSQNVKKLDINQVNEMLKEVEIEEKKHDIEKPCVKEKIWQAGDNINSVPDYRYGMRNNMYLETKKSYSLPETSIDKSESDLSSESTQTTAFEKFKYNKSKDKNYETENYNLGMVSLAKLWNSQELQNIPSKFQQKLQEEKLRRQISKVSRSRSQRRLFFQSTINHCEQAIQELQNRVLELQERIAVAIQVDEAKDKAILRFHDSWEKTGIKLKNIEKQKEGLEDEIEKLRQRLNEDSEETNQKIAHYEKEASLALSIAHNSQDKLAAMEQRYEQLENDFKNSERISEEFKRKYNEEVEKNRQYPEILAQKELELNECKTILNEARREVAQSKKAVETCQAELLSMKNENESLQSLLDVEKVNSRKLNEQKNKLLDEVSAQKNVAKGLQEELTKARDQLETNKIELKNFYQGQVELVVQNKLKEFQKQLDEAEKALKDELAKKEMSIAKTAATHIQQISEKHSLEIKLLEEKHQEECRLYQLQISQLRHEIEESNHRIKRQHEKHLHIEKQLHKFMESLRQDHLNTPEEVNSFRSKSFNNLEEILSFNMPEEGKNRKTETDENYYKFAETPVSSRNEKSAKRKEGSLQETIQMLLDRKSHGDVRSYDDGQQATKDSGQKLGKDMKGKPPWK